MTATKVTPPDIVRAKQEGRKLVEITAYDYPFGLMAQEAGVDIVLVGDSVGMAMLGMETTVPVTLDMMIHHTQAVVRGCKTPLVVTDMPYMTCNTGIRDAIMNCGRLMQEGGCDAVKIEGGEEFGPVVEAVVKAGIPVQGHIGLTPQTAGALGGFKTQGKDTAAACKIIKDAKAIEAAGAFSIVVEAVPAPLGQLIAESVSIPIVGIGAGVAVDGQVLVIHDILGLFDRFVPKFVKPYATLRPTIIDALKTYGQEVRTSVFPDPEHSFIMSEKVLQEVREKMR
ncbi:3-methyl-2-oxobutanoate hydroxymethyltransferase [Desulfosarcina sp. OttesenSCG-928-A07]|nr:3-methyl-2-oxobutanoate hydroxymethyltransferase [Desulfosarcina sp. OttesenSCG-928-A07]